MAFTLRLSAKGVRSIVSVWIPAIVPAKIRKALVQRLDFDAPERFQVDFDHDDSSPLGSSTLSPARFLVALGGLKLCRCLPASAVVVNLAVQSEAVRATYCSVSRNPHLARYLRKRKSTSYESHEAA